MFIICNKDLKNNMLKTENDATVATCGNSKSKKLDSHKTSIHHYHNRNHHHHNNHNQLNHNLSKDLDSSFFSYIKHR